MNKLTLLIIIPLFVVVYGCSKNEKTSTDNGIKHTATVETVEYKCDGMHCSGCEESITNEVKKLNGITEIKADAKAKIVTVSFDNSKTNKEEISKAINTAGYDTEFSKSENKHDCSKETKE